MMLIPIPILIVAVMVGMVIVGLIRPPITVIIPLLGIYAIMMLLPYIIPNLLINQYLNIRYVLLPLLGLALGYGVSLVAERFMSIDTASILRVNRGSQGRRRRAKARRRVEKKPEVKPEEIERIITESIDAMRLGALSSERFGTWVEYYENWTDAILSISKNFLFIKESLDLINRDAMALSRFTKYETKALELGFSVREESSFKSRKEHGGDELVAYVRPEDIAMELVMSSQLLNDYFREFDGLIEKIVHNEELSQYMANSHVLVLYVDGLPRKFVLLH